MIGPKCDNHGSLVVKLAQGQLNDEQYLVGEAALSECATCRAWWADLEASETYAVVDDTVAGAISEAQILPSTQSHWWHALAAMAVLALASSVLWNLPRATENAHEDTLMQSVESTSTIVSSDPAAPSSSIASPSSKRTELTPIAEPHTAESDGRIFSSDFETGGLVTWQSET
ncbi:MAG: hypothetical protein GY906_39980 [bacterium]|nr:hypothetical protein [bacterium]